MKKILHTAISGEDGEDILYQLARETRNLGGEWLITKVIKLDGYFTALMRLSVDEAKLEQLEAHLSTSSIITLLGSAGTAESTGAPWGEQTTPGLARKTH